MPLCWVYRGSMVGFHDFTVEEIEQAEREGWGERTGKPANELQYPSQSFNAESDSFFRNRAENASRQTYGTRELRANGATRPAKTEDDSNAPTPGAESPPSTSPQPTRRRRA